MASPMASKVWLRLAFVLAGVAIALAVAQVNWTQAQQGGNLPVISLTSSLAGKEGDTAVVNVSASFVSANPFTIPYTIGDDDDANTPNADADDFTSGAGALSGSVTLPAQSMSATISISIADDDDIEPTVEYFKLTLDDPGENAAYQLDENARSFVVTISEGVCDRTRQVSDALMVSAGTVDCSGVTSTDLDAVTSLDLSDQGISTLKSLDFQGLENLGTLRLDHNQLASLPAGVFAGLSNLETLALNNNALTSLPADVFAGLSNLETLALNNNALTSLEATDASSVFIGLTSLESLALNHNSLTGLHRNLFGGHGHNRSVRQINDNARPNPLTNLRVLNLADNSITELRPVVFLGLTGLEELLLGDNELAAELSSRVFCGLSSLEILDLSHNGMASLDADLFDGCPATYPGQSWAVPGNTNLSELYLNHNALTGIPAGVLSSLTGLTVLHLQFQTGNLSGLDADTFAQNTELIHLDLTESRLHPIPEDLFDGLTKLEFLNLSRNELSSLPDDLFDGLGALEELDLDRNQLTQVSADQFEGAPNLTALFLSNNRLESLPAGVFGNLTQLERLWLNHNDFAALTSNIFVASPNSTSRLRELRLRNNDLTTLPEDMFQGTPGLETISIFGNKLVALPQNLLVNLSSLQVFFACGNEKLQGFPDLPPGMDVRGVFTDPCKDAATASITLDPTVVAEGDSQGVPVQVTARLESYPVNYHGNLTLILSGDAVEGVDYTIEPYSIIIPQGYVVATGTVTFVPVDDGLAEAAESIVVDARLDSLRRNDAGTGPQSTLFPGKVAEATLTLADNDSPATDIFMSVSPQVIREDVGARDITVTASLQGRARGAATTVAVQTGGTAVLTDDYTISPTPFSITIPAGATSASAIMRVLPVNDNLQEGDETIEVAGTSDGGLTVNPAEITIQDDEIGTQVNIDLSVSPDSIGEADGATGFTLTYRIDGSALPSTSTVSLTLEGSAEGGGTDYTASPPDITIPTGSLTGSIVFDLTPAADEVVEGDETIVISGSHDGGFTVIPATITLTDDVNDTATLSITGPTGEVNEGGDAAFTVTLSHQVAADVIVAWSAPGAGDAAVAADLATTSSSVIFSANSAAGATRTFTIGAVDDPLSEMDETFTVTLGAASSTLSDRVALATASATATIEESDPITVEISGDTTVAEGASASYTVSLSPVGVTPTADLTVDYATADGSAVAGSDYTTATRTLTFTQGDAGDQTVTVDTLDDVLDDDDETFSVAISDPQGGGGPTAVLSGTASSVTTTITDDDGTPTAITLSVSTTTIGEADGETGVTVTATLVGSSTRATATTVTLSLSGTASDPDDYAVTTALASLTIPAGQSDASATLTLTPVSDEVVEGDETVTVDGDATGFTVSSATITITDDDTATLSITGPASAVTEGANAVFTVTLSHAVDADVTVAWSAPGAGDAGAADLSATAGSVTFAANSAAGATRTVTIGAVNDPLSEMDETFTVTLGTVSSTLSDRVSLATASATATIEESDPITVEISGDTTVAEGASASYTVSLSPVGVTPTADLTVDYATADGTAVAGSDYTSSSGTLTFTQDSAGEQTFIVDTLQDTLDDDDETYTVTLSNAQGGGGPAPTLSTTDASVTTTITDDDGTPTNITLSVNTDSIGEADGQTDVTVTATLVGDSTRATATTVTLSLSGTASDPADYAVTTALTTVTIPAGRPGGSVTTTLTPAADQVVEGDETVTVDGAVMGFTVTPATITITDDDTATLSITGPTGEVNEGGDAAFTVTLSHQVAADVTVAWSAPGAGDAAVAADLSTTAGTVTFAANSAAGATRTVTIGAVDDMLSEMDETFTVTLGTITSDLSDRVSLATGNASATATIAQSDPITVEIDGPATVAEGAMASYTVSLSPVGVTPTADLTVDYATADGSAVAGSDYTTATGTLTFTTNSAGEQTFTVQTTQDTLDDDNETFTVTLSNARGGGGPAAAITPASVTTTIVDDDGTPTAITLSVNTDTIGEADGDTEVTVTATLVGDSTRTEATTVTLSLSGSAESGDYAVTPALTTVTIPAGRSSGSVTTTLTPAADQVVEGDETIVVGGTVTGVTGLTVSSATITITDDDTATLSITGPAAAVTEGADAVFTVTLSHAVDADVTVAWSAPGAGDAGAADLGSTAGSVTFAANSAAGATRTVTIEAVDDLLSEGDETFTVTLGTVTSDLSDRVSLATASATATIAESDPITVQLTGPATVAEGAMASYTVSLAPDGVTPTADLTVDYATSDGSAVAGSDYTSSSDTLTFTQASAGEQTFTVTTLQDTLDDDNETFSLTISNPQGGGGPAPTLSTTDASVTTTITDDDGTPTAITLSVSTTTIGEADGDTEVTVTATLVGDSTRTTATTVTLSLSGAASNPDDYAVTTALASLTIPAGQADASATLTLTPVSDAVVEGDETVTVDGDATGFTVSSATITLQDDDEATLSITGPAAAVTEGANATFTVTLSHAVDESVMVAWSAPGAGDAGAADLSATAGSVTFAANSAAGATRTVTIGAVDDMLSEGDETFTVTLGTITSDLSDRVSLATGNASATATIAQSDPITVEISGDTTVAEGAMASYTVSLSPVGVTPTADLTVDYATSDGSAVAGSDYTAATRTLTFTQASAGEQTFTVTTLQDTLDDDDETFTVTLSNARGGGGPAPTLSTTDASVTTTITDDDGTPTAITLSVNTDSIGEADGETGVTVTATLVGTSTRATATTVTLSLSGTASDPADYAVTTPLASLTIPAGQAGASATLTLTPVSDAVVEGDETVTVDGDATDFTVSSATITLEDDDEATLSIAGPTASVTEGANAVFTVTLSHAVDADVTVAWSAPGAGDDVVAADLGSTSGTVTFAANSAAGATRTVTIGAVDDMLSEGDETFTVTLGTITSDLSDRVSLATGNASATATIEESDPITVQISGPDAVPEGGPAEYTVSLAPTGVTPTAELTVDYATSDGSAVAGSDYTAESGTLTFTQASAGEQTFTVQTTQDTLDDDDETFTVTLSNARGGGGPAPTLSTTDASVTTTITDDDGTPTAITLSVNTDSIGEADGETGVTVTATLVGTSTRATATTVTLSLSGTASDPADYAVTTPLASLTIPAGQAGASATLTLTPVSDAVVEGDETVTVDGDATDFTVSSATITLEDDDEATLSIAGPTASVTEGANAVFTVTLSHAVDADVTVAWSAPGAGDDVVAADLGSTSGTVTFAANSAAGATRTVTIGAVDDLLSEGDETFTVILGTITSDLSDRVSLATGNASATATIEESDPITVQISGPDAVPEGGPAEYTVSLAPTGVTPTAELTVDYATSDGSAVAGSDYTAESGTLTFTQDSAGEQTFTVQTTQDTLDDDDETFTVTLSNARGGGGPAPTLSTTDASVTTTITDDDGTPTAITLSVNTDSIGEADGETGVTVTATLVGTSTRATATTVTLSLSGAASNPDDYAVTTPLASLTIPAGQADASATLTLTPVSDAVVEGDETVTVDGDATDFTVSSATITLQDDDEATLSITGPTAEVSEGSDAAFTVTLSHQVAADVSVPWSAPGAGDAAVAADLATTSSSVIFSANSAAGATQTFTIGAVNDLLSEMDETFTVTLGTVTSDLSDRVSLATASATATIEESDPITVEISGDTTVAEGDSATYTVSLAPTGVPPTADLTVDYATSDGSAVAGSDYTSSSDTLTFTQASAGEQTLTVTTLQDTLDDDDETFSLTISNPQGGGGPTAVLSGTAASVTTTITDDDGTPTAITLSVSRTSIGEADGETGVTVTATLVGTSTRATATTVTLSLSGTASDPDDYAVTTPLASLTIPAGQSGASATLTLTPVSDAVVEGDETVTVDGDATDFTVTSATITLEDDDEATLSITGPTAAVNEGADAVFTVTLSHAVDADVTVAWSAPGAGDAAEAADLSATSSSVRFTANSAAGATRTVTIRAVDDMLSEGDETFTVTLGAVTSTLSDRVSLATASATATIEESDPITVEITGDTTVAEGASASYTVSLSPTGVTPTADLTVDYATSDGTATAGSDYTAATDTLTFTQASAGEQTFIVDTLQDTLDDDDETFSVTLSNARGGGGPAPTLSTTDASVTTTITDDDGTPTAITLSVSRTSIGEADGETGVTVTATLVGTSTRATATTVTLSLSGAASDPDDYAVTTPLASLTIPAGQAAASATLTLTPVSDAVVEGDETVTVDGDATDFTVTSATITLEDDDDATLSITGPAASVTEGADATFTVTLSHSVDADVTVAWSAPGTGDAGAADLSATAGSVTFAANSAAGATRTVTIGAVDDLLSEGDETFTVTLGAVTSTLSDRVSLATASATATIEESDPITVEITGDTTVAEGASASYTVSLSPTGVTPTADLTVDYATSDGTATAGSDYTAATDTLTFTQASAGEQTFIVDTLQDTLDDDNETFSVTLSNARGGGGPAPTLSTTDASVTTTITDDDGTPTAITLSVSRTSIGEADGETGVTVTATLVGTSTRATATTVTLSLSGAASDPDDYAVTTPLASLTIPAGQAAASATLTLTPVSDAVVEGDETVTVDGDATDFTVTSATITLEDDDDATLSITGPAASVTEGADATFTVTLSHSVDADVTVAWSAPGTGDAGAADLSATAGTVTFAANSAAGATRTVTIEAVDDLLSEGDETFTVTLGAVTSTLSDRVSLATASATATIEESDPITVEITGDTTVAEGASASYTVSLSPTGVTPTADLTVDYATSDGTATAGSDYTAATDTLTFTQASAGEQTFIVDTLQDTLDDDNETFTVTLSNARGGGGPAPTLSTTDASVTTTITDDDGTPTNITLSVNTDSIGEADGDTEVTVTATLVGDSTRTEATTVTLTLSGSASNTNDYSVTTALTTVTIPAGRSSGSVTTTLTPVSDQVVEGDETIVVGGTVTGVTGLAVSSATITITDDDTATLSITGPTAAVTEGANAAFTVTLSHAVDADVTVAWSAPGAGDDVVAADLGSTSGTVTFAANSAAGATRTVTIRAVDDMLSEMDETFTVTLGTVTSGLSDRVSLDTASATGTIAESDPITVQITGPATVAEGAMASYTVSLAPTGVTPTADLTVDFATSDGSAVAGSDYTAATDTLTFTQASAGEQTFTVDTTQDTLDDDNETFTVTLSNARGGGGPAPEVSDTASSVTTTITDDDDPQVSVSFGSATYTVAEGDTVTVTVSLSADPERTVTIPLTRTNQDGASNADYSGVPDDVTFNSGNTQQSFTFTATDDTLDDDGESVLLGFGSPLPAQVSAGSVPTATISITDDDGTPTAITLSVNTDSIGEADAETDVTVTATLAGGSSLPTATTVSLSLSGTASDPADYTVTTAFTSVIIPAGQPSGSGTLTVTPVSDQLVEGDETVVVDGTATGFTVTPATIILQDDDVATLSIRGPTAPVTEGLNATFTVTLSHAVDASVAVAWLALAAGDDAEAGDLGSTSGTVSFNSGQTRKSFTIGVVDDMLSEVEETFTVKLGSVTSGLSNRVSVATASATATIAESDPITVEITGDSTVAEGASASYTVSLFPSGVTPTEDLTVDYATSDGSATAGSDYTSATGTLTFAANSADEPQAFTVATLQDTLDDDDETFAVTLSNTQGGGPAPSVSATSSSQTTTIIDDDAPTAITRSVNPTTIAVDRQPTRLPPSMTITVVDDPQVSVGFGLESGATIGNNSVTEGASLEVIVTLSADPKRTVTIPLTRIDQGGASSADYSGVPDSVTFNSGETRQSFTFTATQDTLDDDGESVLLRFGSTLPARVSAGSVPTATISIIDDDGTPTAISLSVSSTSIGESDAETSVTVTATLAGTSTLTTATAVSLSLSGTASDPADYAATTALASVTIPAGQPSGSGTLTVTPTADQVVEGDETVVVDGSVAGFTVASVTIILQDDDQATVSISGPTAEVSEGSDATFTVTLSHTVDASVAVAWSAPGAGATAETGDLDSTSGTVTFGANSAAGATRTFTIGAVDDKLSEDYESFTVALGPVTSSLSDRVSVTTESATSTIVESDPITVVIDGPDTVAEGASASYTVSLSPSGVTPTEDLTVDYATTDGTAAAGIDYTPTSGTLTFTQTDAGSQTIMVQTTDDVLDDDDETFSVTISNPLGGGGPTPAVSDTASSVITTITDDDQPPRAPPSMTVAFEMDSYSVAEGDSIQVIVTLSADPERTVTIPLTKSNLGGASSADYSGVPDNVIFDSGDTQQSFTFRAIQDSLDDDGESVRLGFGPLPARVTLGATTEATVSMIDDDPTTPLPTPPQPDDSGIPFWVYILIIILLIIAILVAYLARRKLRR